MHDQAASDLAHPEPVALGAQQVQHGDDPIRSLRRPHGPNLTVHLCVA